MNEFDVTIYLRMKGSEHQVNERIDKALDRAFPPHRVTAVYQIGDYAVHMLPDPDAMRRQVLAEVREALEGLDRFSFQPDRDPSYNGMIGDEDGLYIKRPDVLATLTDEETEAQEEEKG